MTDEVPGGASPSPDQPVLPSGIPRWEPPPYTPPTYYTPESLGSPGSPEPRKPSVARRTALLLLILGLVVGGAVAFGITKATSPTKGSVTINVDNTPVHVANNNASGVAQSLVPA